MILFYTHILPTLLQTIAIKWLENTTKQITKIELFNKRRKMKQNNVLCGVNAVVEYNKMTEISG